MRFHEQGFGLTHMVLWTRSMGEQDIFDALMSKASGNGQGKRANEYPKGRYQFVFGQNMRHE